MRSLQAWYLTLFNPMVHHPSKLPTITKELASQLTWWSNTHNLHIGRPFKALWLAVQVTMDASPMGWGAHCKNVTIHGLWSPLEVGLHISHLELLEVIKAFCAFESLLTGCVQVATDNTTVLLYTNKQRGTHSLSLLYLIVQLWEWCYDHHIYLIAVHISTEDNGLADYLSGLHTCSHEWFLDADMFYLLCWGIPQMNVFPSPTNAKCPHYCSRARLSPQSVGDAFMVTCNPSLLYLFLTLGTVLDFLLHLF